ncbi:hypothetical protein CWI36_0015p0070 [Hamiltosporidium magnivora]|uniref:Uncharacterized protein n=1 Tax=Hamiltosporidium magnivora TaxID=148818 RepID=A0A4V2JV45_9MICR|nr:hypothetical protein CWI36_1077p0010 [Hamiltosporidium magnivora]TBU09612.1 hypothetical protein CWI36_0015p0070 [Hamiltosporidium magnivora]
MLFGIIITFFMIKKFNAQKSRSMAIYVFPVHIFVLIKSVFGAQRCQSTGTYILPVHVHFDELSLCYLTYYFKSKTNFILEEEMRKNDDIIAEKLMAEAKIEDADANIAVEEDLHSHVATPSEAHVSEIVVEKTNLPFDYITPNYNQCGYRYMSNEDLVYAKEFIGTIFNLINNDIMKYGVQFKMIFDKVLPMNDIGNVALCWESSPVRSKTKMMALHQNYFGIKGEANRIIIFFCPNTKDDTYSNIQVGKCGNYMGFIYDTPEYLAPRIYDNMANMVSLGSYKNGVDSPIFHTRICEYTNKCALKTFEPIGYFEKGNHPINNQVDRNYHPITKDNKFI